MPHRNRRARGLIGSVVLIWIGSVVLIWLVAACGPSVVTPSPSGAPPSATAPAPGLTPVPTDPGATARPSPPTQTDTEWGRIWDALPEAFPRYPGANPTETGEGPASAILDVGDAEPAAVATFYQSALEAATYSTLSMSGPREDGSWEIESAGEAACRTRTTITPLGGTTIVTILFGVDCPFE